MGAQPRRRWCPWGQTRGWAGGAPRRGCRAPATGVPVHYGPGHRGPGHHTWGQGRARPRTGRCERGPARIPVPHAPGPAASARPAPAHPHPGPRPLTAVRARVRVAAREPGGLGVARPALQVARLQGVCPAPAAAHPRGGSARAPARRHRDRGRLQSPVTATVTALRRPCASPSLSPPPPAPLPLPLLPFLPPLALELRPHPRQAGKRGPGEAQHGEAAASRPPTQAPALPRLLLGPKVLGKGPPASGHLSQRVGDRTGSTARETGAGWALWPGPLPALL